MVLDLLIGYWIGSNTHQCSSERKIEVVTEHKTKEDVEAPKVKWEDLTEEEKAEIKKNKVFAFVGLMVTTYIGVTMLLTIIRGML